ncbi:MAG: hypothetical protein KKE62_06385 [Proteobacteria bacterium]|nr:hypothetical protein [Pseudomonadota bacterium]MBU1542457.1 hypothetical protein [Pseudomonadota bacterium]
MFDLKLPDFEIVVWINYNAFGKNLEKEILAITGTLEFDEEMETEGIKSYHWVVPSWVETLVLGGKLKEHIDNPNLVLLKLKANYDSAIQDVTLKDDRKYKKI